MRHHSLRRTSALAAAGALAALVAAPDAGSAAAKVSTDTASYVVPAQGSGTAYGYTALIRHKTSEIDRTGRLVLVAPDGRSKSVGQVAPRESVRDVSSNARTILTNGLRNTGRDMILTVWDSASGTASSWTVRDGRDAVITARGIVVSREGKATQVFTRSGDLVRTIPGGQGQELVASADGNYLLAANGEGRVEVRDAWTGELGRTALLPKGSTGCQPAFGYFRDFTMDCNGTTRASTSYVVGYGGDPTPVKIASESFQTRPVENGVVHHTGDGDTVLVPRPKWQNAKGVVRDLTVNKAPEDGYQIVGARGDAVYLAPSELEYAPSGMLVRKSLSTGKDVVLAGPGSKVAGLVTSAKTVDGT